MHILIGMPAPATVHSEFALANLPEILQYTAQKLPQVKVSVASKQGIRTDANRNEILAEALSRGSIDYVLWLDCDMIYPANIIERYLELPSAGIPIDVVGCLYFRRGHPFDAVAYEKTTDPLAPYRPIFPPNISEDRVYEIDGIGFGGMLVSMETYRKLGEKKWSQYGKNFHLPGNHPEKLTHDLAFCADVKAAGMSVKLHGGVRAKHLYVAAVTIEDWRRTVYEDFEFRKKPPVVQVVVPARDPNKAKLAAALMQKRAGCDCTVTIVPDEGRGFAAIVNDVAASAAPELLVYTNENSVPGEQWLKHAVMTMAVSNAGLVEFHHGSEKGSCAVSGLVNCTWTKQLFGDRRIFFPEYRSRLAAAELTAIAIRNKRYHYGERAVLLDADIAAGATLELNSEAQADQQLFRKREAASFA